MTTQQNKTPSAGKLLGAFIKKSQWRNTLHEIAGRITSARFSRFFSQF